MSLADDSDADVKECPYKAPVGLICRQNYENSVLCILLGRADEIIGLCKGFCKGLADGGGTTAHTM